MTTETPFFLTKVECPICRAINEFETVRLGAYVEESRDTDFCPQGISWRNQRYQGYNPLIYFIATCSNCMYSRELTNSFRDWKNDQQFRQYRLKSVKDRHLDQLARDNSVIRYLGQSIDVTHYPNESAILKTHLAIFDEQLIDRPNPLDIGRFYLRIAWVFRGMDSVSDPSQHYWQGQLAELEQRHDKIQTTYREMHERIAAFSEILQDHFGEKDITSRLQSRQLKYQEQFREVLEKLQGVAQHTSQELAVLDQLMREYHSIIAGSDISAASRRFHHAATLTDFLLEAKQRWPEVVTNEHEALVRAVEFYKKAFTEGHGISPGNQQIQACYLIAELSRRTGNFEQAKEYFNSTIRTGQEFIYRNRDDRTQTALARKILELAIDQGKQSMLAAQPVAS